MPIGKHINPSIKAEILDKIRNQGVTVREAAESYGISSKTIYTWMRSNVLGNERNLMLENIRLRKENEQLYNLLGRATAELKRPKV